MIKVEVLEEFTFKDFYKLKNIQRKTRDVKGKLLIGDIFECDEETLKYLAGNNKYNKKFVKLIEVIKEADVEEVKDENVKKPKKSTKKKK